MEWAITFNYNEVITANRKLFYRYSPVAIWSLLSPLAIALPFIFPLLLKAASTNRFAVDLVCDWVPFGTFLCFFYPSLSYVSAPIFEFPAKFANLYACGKPRNGRTQRHTCLSYRSDWRCAATGIDSNSATAPRINFLNKTWAVLGRKDLSKWSGSEGDL